MYRVEWIRHQEREKKKLEDEKEKERGWFCLVTGPYSICTCNIVKVMWKYWHNYTLTSSHWLFFVVFFSILILKAQFCCLGIFVAYVVRVLSTALIVLEKLQFGTQSLCWGSTIGFSYPTFPPILPVNPAIPPFFFLEIPIPPTFQFISEIINITFLKIAIA